MSVGLEGHAASATGNKHLNAVQKHGDTTLVLWLSHGNTTSLVPRPFALTHVVLRHMDHQRKGVPARSKTIIIVGQRAAGPGQAPRDQPHPGST